MRESAKVALGGIVSALAVTVMLITYFSPLLVYTAPPFAGLLLLIIVNELGTRWAVGTYAAISLLSIFIIADKEAAVFFTMFFGYYPILKKFFDKHIHRLPLRAIVKLSVFNGAVFVSVLICQFVFRIPYDELSGGGYFFVILFILLANCLFVVYDLLITRLQILYSLKLKKMFKKLFKH